MRHQTSCRDMLTTSRCAVDSTAVPCLLIVAGVYAMICLQHSVKCSRCNQLARCTHGSIRPGCLCAARKRALQPAEPLVRLAHPVMRAPQHVHGLQEWWENNDEKPTTIALIVAGFVALWGTSGTLDAVNRLPLIGGVFEVRTRHPR